jgi:hypothetical protein
MKLNLNPTTSGAKGTYEKSNLLKRSDSTFLVWVWIKKFSPQLTR